MLDAPARLTSANVLTLEELLAVYEPSFGAAVQEALIQEGFERTHGFPNLQLAGEILASIGWLGNAGHGPAWDSLRLFLEWAEHRGVLVDLGLHDHTPLPATA